MTKEKMIERLMKIINNPVGNNTKLKMLITSIKAHKEDLKEVEQKARKYKTIITDGVEYCNTCNYCLSGCKCVDQEKDLINPSI